MNPEEMITKKLAAELTIGHLRNNTKIGVTLTITTFFSIIFTTALGLEIGLITWLIGFIYTSIILFKTKKEETRLIQKYELNHLLPKKITQQRINEVTKE
jgi:hypothetical protein